MGDNHIMNENPLPNRHRYAAEIGGYRPGIIRRVLLALHLVKRVKASAKVLNWHYSGLDTGSYLTTIHGVRDGHRVVVGVVELPPEHPPIPIRHV